MRLLQLTALANKIGWRNEWAWDYTDLSYCSDSSGRMCFSFLLYHYFFIIPRSIVMTERWWRTGGSYYWESVLISFVHDGDSLMFKHIKQLHVNIWFSLPPFRVRGTKKFSDIITSCCGFLPLVLKCQYPVVFLYRDPIAQPWGQYEPGCPWKENFYCTVLSYEERLSLTWFWLFQMG